MARSHRIQPEFIAFGARVRELRLAAGFGQNEFARHAKLNRSYYQDLEAGRINVSLWTMAIIARALACDLADFFEHQRCND
jgi:transcriptional regulator with XRE-family HTH domain